MVVLGALLGGLGWGFYQTNRDLTQIQRLNDEQNELTHCLAATRQQLRLRTEEFPMPKVSDGARPPVVPSSAAGPDPLEALAQFIASSLASFSNRLEHIQTDAVRWNSATPLGGMVLLQRARRECDLLKQQQGQLAATAGSSPLATSRLEPETLESQVEHRVLVSLTAYGRLLNADVAAELEQIAVTFQNLHNWLWFAVAGLATGTLLAASMATRAISRPLADLSTAAIATGRGDFAPVSLPASGELRQLATALNHMKADLQASVVSKEYVTEIINAMPDGLVVMTRDGIIKSANRAAEVLLGRAGETLRGQALEPFFILPPGKFATFLHRVQTGSGERNEEWKCHSAAGREVPVLFTAALLNGVQAPAGEIVCGLHDLTVRYQAQQSLRHQYALLRSIVESSPDLIYLKDCGGRYVAANSAACEVFGQALEELVGVDDFAVFPARVAQQRQEQEQQVLADQQPVQVEEIHTRDGAVRTYATCLNVCRDPNGHVLGLVGFSRDVTEAKRSATELAQLHQRVVTASRLAGMAEVATGVLHNVGNVLNSVSVSATLVREQLAGSKLASLRRAADLLREPVARAPDFFTRDPKGRLLPEFLVRITEQLTAEQLTWQKELAELTQNIEHIKRIVAMQQCHATAAGVSEVVAPTELLEDALRLNEAALRRDAVQVTREFATVPPVAVDKHKALMILVNLIGNACQAVVQAGPASKQITVRAACSPAGGVQLTVADNGVGIDQQHLSRIFGMGFTTKKDGHGFGLHSSANAAREMGGALSVQSAGPGRGATFTLELPPSPEPRMFSPV